MKVQPPYGSRVSILSRSQIPIAKNKKAELSLLMLEGCTAAAWRRIFAPQASRSFFVWYSVTTWFQAGHFPRIRKTSWALPRFHKVSEAQYQLLSKRCQEENAKYR